jgi:sugar/nucleoside kinase (ribokinase family)
MTKTNLLVVGSVAFDTIITPFGRIDKALGGSATYFSLASSLFNPTMAVAVVGEDLKNLDVLKKHGVDISGIKIKKGKTFHWAGKYHFDMNTRETLKTELGVFKHFKPKLDKSHCDCEYVFLGNIHPKLQLDVLKQIKYPKLVGLDTMNFWIEQARADLLKVMKQIDLLVINDGEARELSGQNNLIKAARKILSMMTKGSGRWESSSLLEDSHLSPILIIKQGEHGLLMFSSPSLQNLPAGKAGTGLGGVNIFNLPGFPLENVVDPTGAGDSFAGALLGFLAKTNNLSLANLKKACAMASAVASFTVEKFGTKRLAEIKISDINKRLTEYKKLIHF